MALIDDFKAKFPEFDSATVDSFFPSLEDEYICYFNCEYGMSQCGDVAILYLLAHLFALSSNASGGSAPSKDVASKSVGSVSVSYVQARENGSFSIFWGSTRYGQRFLMLRNKDSKGGFWV
jgi:hypothetical protein